MSERLSGLRVTWLDLVAYLVINRLMPYVDVYTEAVVISIHV